jgi:hypothetical protein
LILSADGAVNNLGVFDTTGALSLGERVVYKDNADAQRLEIGLQFKETALAGSSGDNFKFAVDPYVWYNVIDKVARAQLSFSLNQGIGAAVKEETDWTITALFAWSLAGTPASNPDDVGTGFGLGYTYGLNKTATNEVPVNKLYFGFKVTY